MSKCCCPLCGNEVDIGETLIVEDRGIIVRGGKGAYLDRTKMRIFMALWDAHPRVVSYDTLIMKMYDASQDEPEYAMGGLKVRVSQMRPELERVGITVCVVHKRGYALNFPGDRQVKLLRALKAA